MSAGGQLVLVETAIAGGKAVFGRQIPITLNFPSIDKKFFFYSYRQGY
jgi:hypothetical protein